MPRSRALIQALLPLLSLPLFACAAAPAQRPEPPIAGAVPADHLIHADEVRFAHLWQLTFGGTNAEAYFSPDGRRLVYQRRAMEEDCDSIWITPAGEGPHRRVSSGRGATTCAYFMPDGERVLYASTHAAHEDCPPRPDHSEGYVWAVRKEFDVYVHDLATDELRLIVGGEGYDAEATVSPLGDRIVFTSSRSGDLELWTCDLDGGDLQQVTDRLGYDGGAFFSHDGEWLVFRSTAWTPGEEAEEQAEYRELLSRWLVRPRLMEIHVARSDGTDRRQVTHLGGASWAPYFFPDDSRILFSSNHHRPGPRPVFDLFAIDVDGTNLERVTFDETFNSFPMFSPDGKWLVFGSNRGGSAPRETNLFLALWR